MTTLLKNGIIFAFLKTIGRTPPFVKKLTLQLNTKKQPYETPYPIGGKANGIQKPHRDGKGIENCHE